MDFLMPPPTLILDPLVSSHFSLMQQVLLSSYYIPHSVLDTKDTEVNKIFIILPLFVPVMF